MAEEKGILLSPQGALDTSIDELSRQLSLLEATDAGTNIAEADLLNNTLNTTHMMNDSPVQFDPTTMFLEPPSYARQTFSLAQPTYATAFDEGQRVRNSFRSGSFWSLKKLPKHIEPGKVTSSRQEYTEKNLNAVQRSPKRNSSTLLPLSKRAEKYVGTLYQKPDILNKLKVDEETFAMESFARKPFNVPSGMNPHPAANFINPDFQPQEVPPDELIMRKPHDASFIHGPFYKAVPPKNKEQPKSKAKLWVKELYKQLSEDWSHLMFSVKLTEAEIIVRFPAGVTQKLPPENAINKYMGRLAAHGNPQMWGLKKRGDRWAQMELSSTNPEDASIASQLNSRIEADEPMLTFAFMLPWVAGGTRLVAKREGNKARLRSQNMKEKGRLTDTRFERLFIESQQEKEDSKKAAEQRHTVKSTRISRMSSMGGSPAGDSLSEFQRKRASSAAKLTTL